VRRRRTGVATAVALFASLLSHAAWALCPNCLGQSPRLSTALGLVGVFLLVPVAVFFAVAVAVKKLSRQSLPPGGAPPGA
jgi:hypothetical protein